MNSANLGPYGDAIETELMPAIEKQFRGIGQGWARFLYGGSTGGWESLAVQMFYPDHYNGAFVACPDPVDFHAYMTTDLYKHDNMFYLQGANKKVEQPAMRDYLGHTLITVRDNVAYEAALGDHGRSGEQFDIWQAVYSPVGADGYPAAHLRQADRRDRPRHRRLLAATTTTSTPSCSATGTRSAPSSRASSTSTSAPTTPTSSTTPST